MASPTTEHHKPGTKTDDDHDSPPPQGTTDAKASPKRKNSEASGGQENHGENGKKKRRKVNHACVYCRRSHMTCDLERPCARCIKRDIGHLCHDEPRDPPKRSKSDVGVAEIAPAPGDGGADAKRDMPAPPGRGPYAQGNNGDNGMRVDANGASSGAAAAPPSTAGMAQQQSTPLSPSQLQRPTPTSATSNGSTFLQNFDWNHNSAHSQFQDVHHLHPNYMFNTSEATNEYNLLNDFLSNSLLDDGGMYSTDDAAHTLFSDPLLASSSLNGLALGLPSANNSNSSNSNNNNNNNNSSSNTNITGAPPSSPSTALHTPSHAHTAAGNDISRPSSTFPIDSRARDKFYMTAADPAGLSSAEDRLHKLLKAKYDAGMLKPFNHVQGYARLNAYISSHLSRASQLRILTQLDRFRPKFREAMQSLTDMQLVLSEMWFERKLMGYDRVFASMAVPACCWRRTGEIFRGNAEMAELIGCAPEALRDGRLAIQEIIAEDSLVSYWEKFGAIAFDNSQKAILTSCVLMLPEARERQQQKGQKEQQKDGGGVQREAVPAVAAQGQAAAGGGGQVNGEKKAVVGPKSVGAGLVRCCFSFTIRRDAHNIPTLIVGNFLPIQPHPS